MSYLWILFHPLKILKKRKDIQGHRKVSDKEIFRYMTYKLYDDLLIRNAFLRNLIVIINRFVHFYLHLVGIKTLEDYESH